MPTRAVSPMVQRSLPGARSATADDIDDKEDKADEEGSTMADAAVGCCLRAFWCSAMTQNNL